MRKSRSRERAREKTAAPSLKTCVGKNAAGARYADATSDSTKFLSRVQTLPVKHKKPCNLLSYRVFRVVHPKGFEPLAF